MENEIKVKASDVSLTNLSFGDRLLFLRRKAGLTQDEVCAGIHVERCNYSRWECGQMNPGLKNLKRIIKFYNSIGVDVDFNFLLKGGDDK